MVKKLQNKRPSGEKATIIHYPEGLDLQFFYFSVRFALQISTKVVIVLAST